MNCNRCGCRNRANWQIVITCPTVRPANELVDIYLGLAVCDDHTEVSIDDLLTVTGEEAIRANLACHGRWVNFRSGLVNLHPLIDDQLHIPKAECVEYTIH